jgi:hypothetical protein
MHFTYCKTWHCHQFYYYKPLQKHQFYFTQTPLPPHFEKCDYGTEAQLVGMMTGFSCNYCMQCLACDMQYVNQLSEKMR